jgi:Spy/CpxP family protein refolding chaperone
MPSNTTNSFKKSALLIAFATAFFLTPLAEAGKKDDRWGSHGKHKDKQLYGNLKKIKGQLNLTEEQEKKLKETQATYGKEAMKKKHDAMEKAQDELSEALKSDATDEKIREKFAALHKIQEDFATVRFEKILYIRSILTPEQRTKFKELIGK